MLTQKQMIRKFVSKLNLHHSKHDHATDDESDSAADSLDICESVTSSPQICTLRTSSISDKSLRTNDVTPRTSSFYNGSNSLPPSPNSSAKKHVKFSNKVRVVLIPCRAELGTLQDRLRWSLAEIDAFKLEAYLEMREFLDQNDCSFKDGVYHLYQYIEPEEHQMRHLVVHPLLDSNDSIDEMECSDTSDT